jgi:hypothetical protein
MMDTMETRTLTAVDRCDKCAAQAYVAFKIVGMELLFCAHHAREHGDALLAKGAVKTVDNTATLEG